MPRVLERNSDFTALVSLELQHFAQFLTSDISSVSREILYMLASILSIINLCSYWSRIVLFRQLPSEDWWLCLGGLGSKDDSTVSPVGVGLNDVESLIVDINIRHPEMEYFVWHSWVGQSRPLSCRLKGLPGAPGSVENSLKNSLRYLRSRRYAPKEREFSRLA